MNGVFTQSGEREGEERILLVVEITTIPNLAPLREEYPNRSFLGMHVLAEQLGRQLVTQTFSTTLLKGASRTGDQLNSQTGTAQTAAAEQGHLIGSAAARLLADHDAAQTLHLAA